MGWGGTTVQYRQSTPVLGKVGPVTDWRSNFRCAVLDRERQSYEGAKGPVLAHTKDNYILLYFASHFEAILMEFLDFQSNFA